MPVPNNSAEQDNGYARIFTLIKEHFSWISPIAVILAFLAGLLNLLLFTWYIGRPDVFSRSLEFGPSLALLMLSYLLIFVAIVGGMLITSFIFTAIPQWLRPIPESNRTMIHWLFGLVVSGMLSLMMMVMILAYFSEGSASGWWMLTVFILPAVCSWRFINVHTDRAEALTSPLSKMKKLGLYAGVVVAVGGVALLGILPAWYSTYLYRESADPSGWAYIIRFGITSVIAVVGSLAPAIGYHIKANDGRAAQIKGALTGLLIFLVFLMFALPAVFLVASVGSVNLLGISEREVRQYLVDNEQYPVSSLNGERWCVEEHGDKRYSINAFSLYAYGSINLLCPSDLASLKNKELSKHSKACISFLKDEIRTLGAVGPDAVPETTDAAASDCAGASGNPKGEKGDSPADRSSTDNCKCHIAALNDA